MKVRNIRGVNKYLFQAQYGLSKVVGLMRRPLREEC